MARRRRIHVLVLILASGSAMFMSNPARAEGDVSSQRLATLAADARSSPAALERLRQVNSVDGRRVDLRSALSGADPADVDARLDELARTAGQVPPALDPGGQASGGGAKAEARAILRGRRFQAKEPPRPLRAPLRILGGWLRSAGRPFAELWNSIANHNVVFGTLAIAVLVSAVVASVALGRRRSASAVDRTLPIGVSRRTDPAELERRADEAAKAGNFPLAVKLRFRAGIIRLAQTGALPDRASLTTGQLRSQLRSAAFDPLAVAFDEIAYGGREAIRDDDEQARQGWPLVMKEAAGR